MKAPTTTHSARYPVLDGVRGLAILFVTLSHLADPGGGIFRGQGQWGVWLFFVLSAFLLSLYFFERPERIFAPLEWTNYFFRRTLRIYPIFIAAVVCGAIAGWWEWYSLWPILSLKAAAYWAIFVEFRAYFILPIFIVAFELSGRVQKSLPAILLGIGIIAHYLVFTNTVPGYEPEHHESLVAYEYLIVFATGSFAAWFYVAVRDKLSTKSVRIDRLIGCGFLLPWLISGAILHDVFHIDAKSTWYHYQWVPFGFYFAACIVGVMLCDGKTRAFLSHPAMRFLGFVSFSTYMFQDFIINYAAKLADTIYSPLVFISIVPILCLSALTFVSIERPLSRISLL